MANVKMMSGQQLPLEMHKVRIVQKINLLPVENRLDCISKAGCNTFLLQNKDVFLDMLTDSGVNAMSDNQQSAMLIADDSYAGSMTFTRLVDKINEILGGLTYDKTRVEIIDAKEEIKQIVNIATALLQAFIFSFVKRNSRYEKDY